MITTNGLVFSIPNDPTRLDLLRALPQRVWHAQHGIWTVPYVAEVYDLLLAKGFKVRHLERPTAKAYRVLLDASQQYLLVKTMGTADDVQRCKQIPDARRFDATAGGWVCKPSAKNIAYVRSAFPQAEWSHDAECMADEKQRPAQKPVLPADFKFKTQPFEHQLKDFLRARDREFYAHFWDQGTGKSKILIDTFSWNVQQGRVQALLVICPNIVKATWEDDELPTHVPDWLKTDVLVWDASTKRSVDTWILSPTKDAVKIMVMNVEALSHDSGVKAATLFCSKYNTMIAIDESSTISNHKASRTKTCLKLAKLAKIRRVADGTPADESPLQYFAQCRFLSPTILGDNFYAFRNKYAVLGGFKGKQVVGYANLEDLRMALDEHSSRVLKSEVFDLPPQLFEKRQVELSPEQKKIYTDLRDQLLAETKSGVIEVQHAITKLLRLHQVVGGFMPATMYTEDPETGEQEPVYFDRPPQIPGENPKLSALLDIIKGTKEKVIVYCRFRPEMDLITKTLRELYGQDMVVEMRGGMSKDARSVAKSSFQEGNVRFLVAQSRAAGRGLTLTACHTVVYYSNDFSLTIRKQSMDRVYRYGQDKPVTYFDLVAKDTIDLHLLRALRKKKSLADLVHGDPTLAWI